MTSVQRVVLDTNVVLDCFMFCDPAAQVIASAVRSRQWQWIGTQEMRQELDSVVDRPELQRWQSRRSATLSAMFDYSGLVDRPVCRLPPNLICSDGDDQMFIDLAWSHRVDCLFTRDKALLRLSRRAREDGVLVLRPVDLVARASGLQNPQTA